MNGWNGHHPCRHADAPEGKSWHDGHSLRGRDVFALTQINELERKMKAEAGGNPPVVWSSGRVIVKPRKFGRGVNKFDTAVLYQGGSDNSVKVGQRVKVRGLVVDQAYGVWQVWCYECSAIDADAGSNCLYAKNLVNGFTEGAFAPPQKSSSSR